MNDFFNNDNRLTRHTLGRAEEVNSIFDAVAAGFDLLPGADEFGENQYAQDTGAANAYVVTLNPDPLSYYEGLRFLMKAVNANTAASTINANAIGVKTIKRYNGDDLQASDITAGMIVYLVYDGTNFRIVSAHGADVALAQSWASSTSVVSGGLKGARGYAQDASTSAGAASSSASSASGSAASALSLYQSFLGTYYGPLSADPALDPNGNAPGAGDWYFNSSTIQSRIYSGSAWGNVAAILTGMEDGSAAAPGLPFAADLDSGLYRIGSNSFGFATNGTLRWFFDSVGNWTAASPSLSLVLAGDGAVGAPGYAFAQDSDTGIYRRAPNDVGFAAGGVLRALYNTTGFQFEVPVFLGSGSVSTPAMLFSADTNTGIFLGGSDYIAFAAGGSEIASFRNAGGYVGLVLPVGSAVFTGNGSISEPTHTFISDIDTGMYLDGVGQIGWTVAGAQRMALDSTSLYLSAGAASTPALSFLGDTNSGFYSAAADAIGISTGGAARGQIAGGSFTGTLTGMSGATTGTVNWIRYGDLVTLFGAALQGTSNAVTMTMTGLPAAIQTGSVSHGLPSKVVTDNGEIRPGSFSVNGGTVTFERYAPSSEDYDPTGFLNTGTKGLLQGIYGTYLLTGS